MDEKGMQQRNSKRMSRRASLKKKLSHKKKPQFGSADQLSRLELYEQYDQNHPLNQPLRPYENFSGPKKEREMTDRFCLVFIVVFLSAQLFHGVVLMMYGDVNRIPNGVDFREEICGVKGLVNLPYLYYAQPTVDINVAWCVNECPTNTGRKICIYDIDHFTPTPFCYIQMTSTRVGRTCIPKEPVNRVTVDEHIAKVENYTRRLMSDLFLSWDVILMSMILLSMTAYFFTYLLSVPWVVKYQVWTQVWCSILCFEVLAYLFWREYERVIAQRCLFEVDKHYCGGDRATLFQLAFAASAAVGVLLLIYVMKLFNKINLGISLIKASAQVVVVLSQLRFFAMFIALIGLIQFGFACLSILFGLTIGERSLIAADNIDGSAVKVYVTNPLYQLTVIYQAFMILFFLLLLLSVNEMFNTYSLSVWFFTKKKHTVRIPLSVVLRELLLHHLGTCVMAVFMELFFFIPKWVFAAIKWFLRNLPQESMIVRFTQGCCLCCLACYQNCLRYLSKHTLVQVAIWSEGYWISAKKSYFLLHRNEDKVGDLDFLIEFILFQLKLSNSLLMSLPIYIYLTLAETTPYGNKIADIESPLIPTLFVFIIGFFYTSVFQVSYDITTKSIIQLYLVDREMFYGEQRFCEEFIQNFMEFYGKKELSKLKMKSHKQLKYNAQVAPLAQPTPQYEPSDEESEEEDDDDDNDDDDYDEQYLDPNQGGTQNGAFNPKVKPTMGRAIVADPFQLDDQLSQDNQSDIRSRSNIIDIQASRTNVILPKGDESLFGNADGTLHSNRNK